jgi:hypothetical protein
LVTVRVCD